jgi:hypothetical protein
MDKRQEGTGQWFLKSPEFVAWVEGPTRTLLCPGIPGAGKTFMTAIVVNYLREAFMRREDIGIAVLYCIYSIREEQTKEELLAGILRQLIKHRHCDSGRVITLYEHRKDAGRRPSFSQQSKLLQCVAATYSTVFVVADAEDECEGIEWSPLMSELGHLQSCFPALRLMVTFRPHVTVTEKSTCATSFEIRADSWDLRHYISGRMSRLSKHVEDDASLRKMVLHEITIAADGMLVLIPAYLPAMSDQIHIGFSSPNSIWTHWSARC